MKIAIWGIKKGIPHFPTHPNDFECSTVQAYSSLFKPVQPSFEGDPKSLIVVPGKSPAGSYSAVCYWVSGVYPGKIAMSKQKYHDHPMWWYCIGEAIFVHSLVA
jgi:hypothetical protein